MVLDCSFILRHLLPRKNLRWHFPLFPAFLLYFCPLIIVYGLWRWLLPKGNGIGLYIWWRVFRFHFRNWGQFRQLLLQTLDDFPKIQSDLRGI